MSLLFVVSCLPLSLPVMSEKAVAAYEQEGNSLRLAKVLRYASCLPLLLLLSFSWLPHTVTAIGEAVLPSIRPTINVIY